VGLFIRKPSDSGIKQTTDPIYSLRHAFTRRTTNILFHIFCIQSDSGGKVGNVGGGSIGQSSYEIVSDSEWLPTKRYLNLQHYHRWISVCGMDEERSLQRKCGYMRWTDCILDVAAHMKKSEDKLRRTTRDLRLRVAKCIEIDGGISGNLLRTVKKKLSYFSF